MEWAHEGRKITISASGRFEIEGSNEGRYESLDSAKAAIDRMIADDKRTKRERLNIPALAWVARGHSSNKGDIVKTTITGVNAGTGKINCTPKIEDRGYRSVIFYPDTPKVRGLLERRKRLANELEATTDTLYEVRFDESYGRLSEEKHGELVEKIKAKAKAEAV